MEEERTRELATQAHSRGRERSRLRQACLGGDLDMVQSLLATGRAAGPMALDGEGRTLIHNASIRGHAHVVDLLLTPNHHGLEIDVNAQDNYDFTALHGACYLGHLDVVRRLLQADHINVNFQHEYGPTPLHLACRGRKVEVVRYLLQDERIDINAEDETGGTPFRKACAMGCSIMATCFLQHMHDNNISIDLLALYENGVLHVATANGLMDVILQFIHAHNTENMSIHMNRQDENGSTLLHHVCELRDLRLFKCLLQSEYTRGTTDLTILNRRGQTSLHVACSNLYSSREMVDCILESARTNNMSLDINAQGTDGRTPLHIACIMGSGHVIESLLRFNEARNVRTNINVQDNNGLTALCWACVKGRRDAVEALLQSRSIRDVIDIFVEDVYGDTALCHATANHREDIVELLLRSDSIRTRTDSMPNM